MQFFRPLLTRLRWRLDTVCRLAAANARPLCFAASLLGLAVGFGLAWLPLGFIVPSAIVCTFATMAHIKGW